MVATVVLLESFFFFGQLREMWPYSRQTKHLPSFIKATFSVSVSREFWEAFEFKFVEDKLLPLLALL